MTHQELIKLNSKLSDVKGLKGFKLNYAIKKNLSKLEPEIKIFAAEENDVRNIAKDFQKDVKELTEKKLEKELHEKEVKLLEEKHKDVIKEANDNWAELMENRTTAVVADFSIYKIKAEDVPNDITTEQMNLIFEIIEE